MACSWAIAPVCAQDISQIAKSDPLIITGSIGTNNTYFHSSAGLGYMSPLSNSFFANLNFNIYGFSMPFSIYFSNDNLNFSYPQFSFNLSPSYKNFTAHIGQSSMPFSQYVLNMSFNGVGLEWRDKQFRASAFYGVLRRAVNDNPDDPTARIPQYRRYGWGISAGYSKGGNSIDLYFLRAYDSESSIDERWRTRVRPQENLVLGLKGQLSYKNFLSLAANVATSAFTADRESQQVMTDEARRFDKIFETRYTSRLRFAGDATLGLTLKGFNASIFYKYIQPDYVSLGTYYTSNNYHTLGLSAGTTLFRRLTLSASFSGQEDNLAKQQLYTTRGYVYNAMASLRVSDRMNVTAMYNGYLQSQGDDTAQVNDTTEIHRVLHSFSLVPTYNLPGELFDHTISLSANYTENRDLNKFSVGQTDVKTLALGASYNLNVKPWETNFTFSLSHQNTKGFNSEYSSDVASISTGRSFLKEKNLSTSATVSLNYNEVRHHSKSLSMGVDLSASYTLKKYHSFSLGASFSQYGDVNLEKTRSTLDNRDVRLTFNYLYTFTLLQVSAKKKDKKEQKEKGSKGRWPHLPPQCLDRHTIPYRIVIPRLSRPPLAAGVTKTTLAADPVPAGRQEGMPRDHHPPNTTARRGRRGETKPIHREHETAKIHRHTDAGPVEPRRCAGPKRQRQCHALARRAAAASDVLSVQPRAVLQHHRTESLHRGPADLLRRGAAAGHASLGA